MGLSGFGRPWHRARLLSATAYQRKDSFYVRAKREGFRSRAAYKLSELQRSHRLVRRGDRVVDLGCWPGGWLQVASELAGPGGRVVGVDLVAIEPPLDLANVIALQLDLMQPGVSEAILEALGGFADALLCDAAPKLSGVRARDRANEEALLTRIGDLVPKLLTPGGNLLLKLMDSPESEAAVRRIRPMFEKAKTSRPEASRKGTSERYLVGSGHHPSP
jgi:23S rRNA (uridine2552-2'-O)-methyltransferase